MYLWFLRRFDADYFEQLRYKSADLTNLIGGKGAEQRFRDRRVENEWDRTRLDNRLTLRIFELKLTSPRAVEGARTKGANSSGQTFHLSLSLSLPFIFFFSVRSNKNCWPKWPFKKFAGRTAKDDQFMELFPKHVHGSDSELINFQGNCQLIIFIDMYMVLREKEKRRKFGQEVVFDSFVVYLIYLQ